MGRFKNWLLVSIVLVLSAVSIYTLVSTPSLNSAQSASPEGVENYNLSSLPFLASTECSSTAYEKCVTDSNSYQDASARATLFYDEFSVLKSTDNKYIISGNTEVDYKCIGTKAYFREDTDTPDIDWSSSGFSADYEQIPLEGSIDLGRRAPLDGVQVICVDHDRDSGYWAGMSVWSYWDRSVEVASDSDGDGLYDFEDACPDRGDQGFGLKEDGCPVEDSDGDGVGNPSDDCPSVPGLESLDGCPNTAPSFSSSSVPDTVLWKSNFSVSVEVYDPDPQELSVEWGNGDTGMEAVYRFDSIGERTIEVSVSDGVDTVTRSWTVEVVSEDGDGDGVQDARDECPSTPGSGGSGCPTSTEKLVRTLFGWAGFDNWMS